MIQVPLNLYFRANFWTVRVNVANDMAMESLRNAKLFCIYYFSQFPMVLSQFWKWIKRFFGRNFYKLYRNEANNIPLKSYGKCETFSCWWCSLIPSRFHVILKMARSFVPPISRNIFFEKAPREELNFCVSSAWTSLYFSHAFFCS